MLPREDLGCNLPQCDGRQKAIVKRALRIYCDGVNDENWPLRNSLISLTLYFMSNLDGRLGTTPLQKFLVCLKPSHFLLLQDCQLDCQHQHAHQGTSDQRTRETLRATPPMRSTANPTSLYAEVSLLNTTFQNPPWHVSVVLNLRDQKHPDRNEKPSWSLDGHNYGSIVSLLSQLLPHRNEAEAKL